MKNQEERIQILKMIETKQITSEEGLKLLDALTNSETKYDLAPIASGDKILRVRVVESNENVKVNVNIPLSLIEVLADVGIKFMPVDKYPELRNLDIKKIINLVHSGLNGKLVDVQAGEGTIVEVYVE